MSKVAEGQKKSRKYYQLLESARRLFMKHGVKRVSVEEICGDAEVSKMTFYRYFDNKLEIAGTMLTEMMEEGLTEYRDIMDSDDSYTDKVTKIIQFKLEKIEDMGADFTREVISSPYSELRDIVMEWTVKSMEMLREDFIKAQKQGEIRQDIKPEFLIFMVNQMRNWTADPALARLYPATQDLVKEMINFFFYGVFDPKTEKK
jgi:AcrR family transcriptional regulator